MKTLTLDVETTISNKGNPFDQTNKLVQVGLKSGTEPVQVFNIEYGDEPFGGQLDEIQSVIDSHDILIGFNIKFDLHWLKRYGIGFAEKRVWDCQLCQFIIGGQSTPYPSLNKTCDIYELESKLDIVATEYWKNGIDTTEVPLDILTEYLIKDVELTHQVFMKQAESTKDNPLMMRLMSLHNQDLLGLQEIEFNGLHFNQELSETLANELDEQISKLDRHLYDYHSFDNFNPNSNDHVSVLLYGGTIKYKVQEPDGVYKTGARQGQEKLKWVELEKQYDKLVTPLRRTELAKEGYYSTDEKTLRNLRGSKTAKSVIQLLLTRSELNKRLGTYYQGLPKLITEMNWKQGIVHGQLNQCVARTGRLSSSKPNLQNFDSTIKGLFPSRY